MRVRYSLEKVLQLVNPCRVEGKTSDAFMTGIASLEKAQEGDLSFLGNAKYKHEVFHSKASFILLPEDYVGTPHPHQVYIYVANPSIALDCICKEIAKRSEHPIVPGIHPSAVIDPTAEVSPKAFVGPLCVIEAHAKIHDGVVLKAHVYIGDHVSIGENTRIMPNVSILHNAQIGKHVYMDSGVIIGSEGFGYETVNKVHEKLAQIGRVVIEDNVDIGANTTIDRARFAETRIGEGTKIDNLVQIAHNVIIGKHCIIVALVGISGSTILEDFVIVGGQAGLAGHLRIGKHSIVGGQSGVNHDIPEDSFIRGSPALPYMQAHRIEILKQRLPEVFKRLDAIEKRNNF